MKNKVTLLLLMILTLNIFCSCDKPVQEVSFSPADEVIPDYDNTSRVIVTEPGTGNNDPTADSSESTSCISGLIIKEKKYTFGANNIVILNVTNDTTNNYKVTITMTYYSNQGEQLKRETQTYNDIASQHSTYFLFQPNIEFDSYTYDVSTILYNEECYLSNIEPGNWNSDTAIFNIYNTNLHELVIQGDRNFYYTLFSNFQYKNNNNIKLYIRVKVVSFNSNDEITYIFDGGDKPSEPNEIINRSTIFHYQLDEFSLNRNTWPLELQGTLKLLIIPYSAITEEEFYNQ